MLENTRQQQKEAAQPCTDHEVMMMMMKWALKWMIVMRAQIKKRRDNDELGNWEHEGAQNANNKGLGQQAK